MSAYGDALAAALHDAAAHERLAALEARVARDGVRDPLTGLTNRVALQNEGDQLLRTLGRDRREVGRGPVRRRDAGDPTSVGLTG